MAQSQGAEIIDFNSDDSIELIQQLTGGIGVDCAIDAVGVDAERPHQGPAANKTGDQGERFEEEIEEVAPETNPHGNWHPGDASSQALSWAVEALAKAGTLSIIGSYPQTARFFPIGIALNKNIKVNMGICNHHKYIPLLINMVRVGTIDPSQILTHVEPLTAAIDAYKAFNERQSGWIKVKLEPSSLKK
jgi:threonine dehydrogenase-like Zn-dependent dehydrogenase